jgi:long-chain fatty acid transport protein
MTKKLCLGLAVILLLASGLLANGLNLNGFGARAAAMGGAFVGLADDYTAVFWNPAGLALMKKGTFGLTGDLLMPRSTYALPDPSTFSMKTESKAYPAGLLGYFQPIGDRIVVGLGAYTLSGLGADWKNTGLEAALLAPSHIPPQAFSPPVTNYNWRSYIGSITIAPAIAVKVTDQIFFGATFNINYGFFKTDQWATYTVIPTKPAPTLFNFGQATLDVKGWGYGATFGLLVKPTDRVSFGLTYRLQSKLKLSGTSLIQNFPEFGPYLLGQPNLPDTSPAKLDAISPTWLAGGLAVKPLTNLTLAFDLQWTNWKKLDTLTVTFQDPVWIAVGKTHQDLTLLWANKLQIRGGLEYTVGDFAVRAGYYYDPAPAPDSTMNILIPSFNYNSITAGFGYKKGDFKVDLGLEYLMGQKRTVAAFPLPPDAPENMPGIYTMKILVPMISLGYGW